MERYTREILDPTGVAAVVDALATHGRAALLCVERDPKACHRSLIAARVADDHGVAVTHMLP